MVLKHCSLVPMLIALSSSNSNYKEVGCISMLEHSFSLHVMIPCLFLYIPGALHLACSCIYQGLYRMFSICMMSLLELLWLGCAIQFQEHEHWMVTLIEELSPSYK